MKVGEHSKLEKRWLLLSIMFHQEGWNKHSIQVDNFPKAIVYFQNVLKMLFIFKLHPKMWVNHPNLIHNVLSREFEFKFFNEARSSDNGLLFHGLNRIQPIEHGKKTQRPNSWVPIINHVCAKIEVPHFPNYHKSKPCVKHFRCDLQ
jgi:hypothetical protein